MNQWDIDIFYDLSAVFFSRKYLILSVTVTEDLNKINLEITRLILFDLIMLNVVLGYKYF